MKRSDAIEAALRRMLAAHGRDYDARECIDAKVSGEAALALPADVAAVSAREADIRDQVRIMRERLGYEHQRWTKADACTRLHVDAAEELLGLLDAVRAHPRSEVSAAKVARWRELLAKAEREEASAAGPRDACETCGHVLEPTWERALGSALVVACVEDGLLDALGSPRLAQPPTADLDAARAEERARALRVAVLAYAAGANAERHGVHSETCAAIVDRVLGAGAR